MRKHTRRPWAAMTTAAAVLSLSMIGGGTALAANATDPDPVPVTPAAAFSGVSATCTPVSGGYEVSLSGTVTTSNLDDSTFGLNYTLEGPYDASAWFQQYVVANGVPTDFSGSSTVTEAGSYTIRVVAGNENNEVIGSAGPFTVNCAGTVVTPTPTPDPEPEPPAQPEVDQIRSEGFCMDTTPYGEVRVHVIVPEGVEPFDLDVVYNGGQSLAGAQTVSETGEYRFQGALPIGDTEFAVLVNGQFFGEGVVEVADCATATPEPTTDPEPTTEPEPEPEPAPAPAPAPGGGDNGGTTNPGTQPGGNSNPVTSPNTNAGTGTVATPRNTTAGNNVPRGQTDSFGLQSDASAASSLPTILVGGGFMLLLITLAFGYLKQRTSLFEE